MRYTVTVPMTVYWTFETDDLEDNPPEPCSDAMGGISVMSGSLLESDPDWGEMEYEDTLEEES